MYPTPLLIQILIVDFLAMVSAFFGMHRTDITCRWFWLYFALFLSFGYLVGSDLDHLVGGYNYPFFQAPYRPLLPKYGFLIAIWIMLWIHYRKGKRV